LQWCTQRQCTGLTLFMYFIHNVRTVACRSPTPTALNHQERPNGPFLSVVQVTYDGQQSVGPGSVQQVQAAVGRGCKRHLHGLTIIDGIQRCTEGNVPVPAGLLWCTKRCTAGLSVVGVQRRTAGLSVVFGQFRRPGFGVRQVYASMYGLTVYHGVYNGCTDGVRIDVQQV